jgi:hypothetical protein
MYELTHHDMGTIQRVAHSLTLEEGIDTLRRISRVYAYREICCNEEGAKPMAFRELLHAPHHRYVLMTHLDSVWFQGGPPGNTGWFEGTPCEVFMDCVFSATVLYGDEYVASRLYEGLAVGAP